MKSPLKSDKYKKVRGGHSRLLEIVCAKCGAHLCYYQKDGPGILKRLYLDRIYGDGTYAKLANTAFKDLPQLTCPACKRLLGIPMVYEKEKRFALRLFVGSVAKHLVKAHTLLEKDHS